MTLTLNGWQRLWVVCSVVWAVIVSLHLHQTWPEQRVLAVDLSFLPDQPVSPQASAVRSALALWIIPVVTTYMAGLAFVWVRAGFRMGPR